MLTIFPQLPRKALTAAEFVTPLARIDPIYKEEEEQFKVRFVVIAMLAAMGMHRMARIISKSYNLGLRIRYKTESLISNGLLRLYFNHF